MTIYEKVQSFTRYYKQLYYVFSQDLLCFVAFLVLISLIPTVNIEIIYITSQQDVLQPNFEKSFSRKDGLLFEYIRKDFK